MRAFTLIELMLVVAVAGVLAALAVPRFDRYTCTAKQTEAQIALSSMFMFEEAHMADQGKYQALSVRSATSARDVTEFAIKGAQRYRYWAELTESGFIGYALGEPGSEVANDYWRIDEQKRLIALVDVCRGTTTRAPLPPPTLPPVIMPPDPAPPPTASPPPTSPPPASPPPAPTPPPVVTPAPPPVVKPAPTPPPAPPPRPTPPPPPTRPGRR